MPLYHFDCGACKAHPVRKLAPTPAQALVKTGLKCSKCGGQMVRTPKPPSSQATERLDNGHMTKAIDRHPDAERLYRERSQNDPRFKKE